MRLARRTLPALAIIAAIALTGCGGEDDKAVVDTTQASADEKNREPTPDEDERTKNLADGRVLPSRIGAIIDAECDELEPAVLDSGSTFWFGSCRNLGVSGNAGVVVNAASEDILDEAIDYSLDQNDSLDVARGNTSAFVGNYGNASDVANTMGWDLMENHE